MLGKIPTLTSHRTRGEGEAASEVRMGHPPGPFRAPQFLVRTNGDTTLANPDSHRNIHTFLCYAPNNGFREVYLPCHDHHSRRAPAGSHRTRKRSYAGGCWCRHGEDDRPHATNWQAHPRWACVA